MAILLFFIFDIKGNIKTYLTYKSYFKALYLGEKMKERNLIMQNCTYPKINDKSNSEVKNLLDPKFLNEIKENANCISQAKLIYIGSYHEDYAVATFRCDNKNLIVEYSWTDFDESCAIIESNKNWKLPEKITIEKLNSP